VRALRTRDSLYGRALANGRTDPSPKGSDTISGGGWIVPWDEAFFAPARAGATPTSLADKTRSGTKNQWDLPRNSTCRLGRLGPRRVSPSWRSRSYFPVESDASRARFAVPDSDADALHGPQPPQGSPGSDVPRLGLGVGDVLSRTLASR